MKKKYDCEKDNLYMKFDAETEKYCYYLNDDKLLAENLTLKSKRVLRRKNKKMTPETKQAEITYIKMQNKMKQDYELRKQRPVQLDYSNSFEYMGEDEGVFDHSDEAFLDELVSEENNNKYLLGVHRIGNTEQPLEGIMNNGIQITGHYGYAGTKELGTVVTYYPRNRTVKKELTHANAWKDSVGSILVKIPFDDLKNPDSIYVKTENEVYLNPKYIVGYFPLEHVGKAGKMVTFEQTKSYIEEKKKEAKKYIEMGNLDTKEQLVR